MSSTTNDRRVMRQDLAAALVALACLPKRATARPEMELASYEVAVETVLATDLAAAVKAILQNALGHPFFPAPPELRMVADHIRDKRLAEAAEERRRRQTLASMAEDRREMQRTPEQRARVADLYRKFREEVDRARGIRPSADEIAAIRAKYGEAALARIPDRTIAPTWQTGANAVPKAIR